MFRSARFSPLVVRPKCGPFRVVCDTSFSIWSHVSWLRFLVFCLFLLFLAFSLSLFLTLSLFLLFYYPVMFSLYSLASCSYYFFFFCSRFSRILFFPLLSSPIFSLLCSPLLSTPIFSLLDRSVLPFSLFSFLFFLTSLLLSFP